MLLVIAVSAALAPAQALGPSVDRVPVLAPAPYDFSVTEALLQGELANLSGRVAVIVRQGSRDVFRFQAGAIDYGTRTRMASFTKTISAGVVLDLFEEGVLDPDERIGNAFPLLFDARGLGDPTVLDCWAMRHGLDAPQEYHRDPSYTHAQSVALLGSQGFEVFRPGERLGYDGLGMQVSAFIAVQRTGLPWESLAASRVFMPVGMTGSDYGQFAPNPAVAGGLRSTALDAMRYAEMIVQGGVSRGTRVLEPASVERLFTNYTRGLANHANPFPAWHPHYPYGVQPDYAFGAWILAENPTSLHVEEIVGAGAWGSYLWLDRRRGLSAVLVTDVPAGSQRSMNAALGLFGAVRAAVEAQQVRALTASPLGPGVELTWQAPAAVETVRVVGSNTPLRDVFELRAATPLGSSRTGRMVVPGYAYYAATAVLPGLHNEALVPSSNSIARR